MRNRQIIPFIICIIALLAFYCDALFYGAYIRITRDMLQAHAADLLVMLAIPLFPLVAGFGILSLFRGRSDDEVLPMPLGLAVGWGFLSIMMWILGTIGPALHINLFSRLVPILLVPAFYLAFRSSIHILARRLRIAFTSVFTQLDHPLPALLILILALLIVRHAIILPLPSTNYDVLEYHLPDVQTSLATGSIAPDPGNVYSLMPQGVEMLYAFGSLLGGAVGAMAPNLINLYLALTAALLAGLIVSELLRQTGSSNPHSSIVPLSAAIIFLGHLVEFTCLSDALIDMGPAVYISAAILCWLRALRLGKPLEFWLCGIFLGLAVSCKYPTAGIAVIPFLMAISPFFPKSVLPSMASKLPSWSQRIATIILIAGAAGLAYLPWLLRALYFDHSPFPPLTISWFGAMDPEHRAIREFMAQAHQSRSIFSYDYLIGLWKRLSDLGVILCAGALYFAFFNRRRPLLSLPIFLLAGYFIWVTVPDSSERFLTPLLPTLIALAVVAVVHLTERWKPAGLLVAAIIACWIASIATAFTAVAFADGYVARVVGATTDAQYFEQRIHATGEFFSAVNQELDNAKSPKLLLVYEARKAAFHAPTISNTIFDLSPLWTLLRSDLGKDPKAVLKALADQGITHIAVNEAELVRLLEFYPVPEAKNNPEFEYLRNSSHDGFNPALLPFRKYYAPFYYFAGDDWTELDVRLNRFFEEIRKNMIWEKNLGGVRFWLSRVP